MVEYHIWSGQIEQVELFLAKKPGLSWQILGPQQDKNLEISIQDWLDSYCSGIQPSIKLPLLLDNLPVYTSKLLNILKNIPFGQTVSYKDLAIRSGKAKAARAVGNACGRNPLPLIIPCHRVLASGGHIGGFSQDLEIKKRLLDFEAIHYLA